MKRMILFLIVILTTVGCVKPLVNPETPIVYPPAPETPRIVYERSLRGSIDFRKVSLIDRLLGVSVSLDFSKPISVYAAGERIYVTDTTSRVVHVLDMKEQKMSSLGSWGMGKLNLPVGVAGLPDGRVFVADADLKVVNVYDATGTFLQAIGKPGELVNPAGIAVNNANSRLYVCDSKAHSIKVYSTKGDFLFEFGSVGGSDGMFLFPSFIAIDRRNNEVYVSDTNNFRVQVFDQDGKFIRKFGDIGDAPGFFQRPKGVGVDSDGNSYVVESVFNNFQLFNSSGQVLTWIGQGGSHAGGLFMSPSGLYVDENDKVYVVDTLNKRLQIFQYLSEKWKTEHPEQYQKYLAR